MSEYKVNLSTANTAMALEFPHNPSGKSALTAVAAQASFTFYHQHSVTLAWHRLTNLLMVVSARANET